MSIISAANVIEDTNALILECCDDALSGEYDILELKDFLYDIKSHADTIRKHI
jgi:hypothetical protein